jgi:geranylgeranyl pyrophosphate synthase
MSKVGDTARLRAGMAAPAPLEALLAVGGPELSRLLHRTESRLGEIAETHGRELGGHVTHTLSAGGKRLRPMLVFLCGGSAEDQSLVQAAVAAELLHMATLVHDDVLDRAPLRRGRPTVVATAGRGAATATGDLLFSRAFAELAGTGVPDAVAVLSEASSALARGELLQRADAWSDSVSEERYLERCELKTARLFEAACRLGALLCDPGPDAAGPLGSFGLRIGTAFQIFDDVLDVSGPTERTGKPRGTDLLDGTVTLPLILARRRDPDLRALDLRSVVTEPAQADALCDRIVLTGALGEARELALRYVAEAKAALSDVDLDERQCSALDLVADGVVERYA